MNIWMNWFQWAKELQKVCTRERASLWFMVALIGFSIRTDMYGVTSFIRCLGLYGFCYDRLLDFFHSSALCVDKLTRAWVSILIGKHKGLVRSNNRLVVVCDGIKIGKSGKKMPGVKLLHQESESNTKPEYIMGHFCQALCVLAENLSSFIAIPLAARIHDGVIFSNRDKRTLFDKMILLINELGLQEGITLLGDAYYAVRKIILPLIEAGNHLISRAKCNAVAYFPALPSLEKRRGRKKVYGEKVKLSSLFNNEALMTEAESPIYGERSVRIRYRSIELLWRPIGLLVLFVAVHHPIRGKCLLLSTDITLNPLEVIRLYGLRFKIEVSFKQSLHTIGSYLYHFWMRAMTPILRFGGNQYMHHQSEEYRRLVRRKIDAYHRFIQIGLIAQGIMAAISSTLPELVWNSFGSWLRTVRPNICPSEMVVSTALKNNFSEFLLSNCSPSKLTKFILQRMDFSRKNKSGMAA